MPELIVQMGHCYRTTGATGTDGEQNYATKVADACQRLLHGKGGWVVNPTLADENDYRGDAFVAIHCDGSVSQSARGASIGYRTPEGQAFGQAWKRAYAARGWPGGFRPDNYTAALQGYYGVRNAVSAGTRRAFIAECGFLTNQQDRTALTTGLGVERVALAIGDALGIPHGWDDPEQDTKEKRMQFIRMDVPGAAEDRWAWVDGTNIIGCTPGEIEDVKKAIAERGAEYRWVDQATWDEHVRIRNVAEQTRDHLNLSAARLAVLQSQLEQLITLTEQLLAAQPAPGTDG